MRWETCHKCRCKNQSWGWHVGCLPAPQYVSAWTEAVFLPVGRLRKEGLFVRELTVRCSKVKMPRHFVQEWRTLSQQLPGSWTTGSRWPFVLPVSVTLSHTSLLRHDCLPENRLLSGCCLHFVHEGRRVNVAARVDVTGVVQAVWRNRYTTIFFGCWTS
jgi:hypothetical protein